VEARSWLIRGGRLVDPASGRDEIADVLIRDGRVAEVGRVATPEGARRFDATGLVVAPGLIDVHVHLREPGFEEKETIASGTAAAAAGGFTTLFCMPNTRPALDDVATLVDLDRRIAHDARVRVRPIAAITVDRAGQRSTDLAALAEAGAVGFSDDGDTTGDSALMRRALEASAALNRPIMVHCEDRALATGAMHEGEVSRRLGLAGIPAEAEEIVIARDLLLAGLTGGWLHVCHVTTARGADMIRRAKAEGVRVTAEAMPHHLTMTDAWVGGDRRLVNVDEPVGAERPPADPNTKVNPSLRTEADARALFEALRDGTIDLVATDHAPHDPSTKERLPFAEAAFGLSGLEFALPLMLALVRAGEASLGDMVTWLSRRPAALWEIPGGSLAVGGVADVVVFDPDERWVVTPERLATKSANTPLLGMTLRGRVKLTLVGGEERYAD
jgi:dihydroorotase